MLKRYLIAFLVPLATLAMLTPSTASADSFTGHVHDPAICMHLDHAEALLEAHYELRENFDISRPDFAALTTQMEKQEIYRARMLAELGVKRKRWEDDRRRTCPDLTGAN